MFPSELTASRSAPLWATSTRVTEVTGMLHPPLPVSLLGYKDFDQSGMAAGGGGVQWRPQLVVLRVDVGSSVQQDLHHLLVVVDATLEGVGGGTEALVTLSIIRRRWRR